MGCELQRRTLRLRVKYALKAWRVSHHSTFDMRTLLQRLHPAFKRAPEPSSVPERPPGTSSAESQSVIDSSRTVASPCSPSALSGSPDEFFGTVIGAVVQTPAPCVVAAAASLLLAPSAACARLTAPACAAHVADEVPLATAAAPPRLSTLRTRFAVAPAALSA